VQRDTRYFNNTAERFLDDVFRELGEDGTTDGGKVIVDAGPNTSIVVTSPYRSAKSPSYS
jgi:hypothetical protein